jgi:hypothetical protein
MQKIDDSSVVTAATIERAEVRAWLDMYAAMPADYRERFRPEIINVDGVTLTRCAAIPFMHFNSVLDLGLDTPATESTLDAVLRCYAGIAKFMILHNPQCEPSSLVEWMEARELQRSGSWERVYRPAGALPAEPGAPSGAVELVTEETAAEWAGFLDSLYGLPTGPWLRAFAVRPGWTHAMLRREGRIVAARSMFSAGGWGWMGVEAPVPGLMAPSYEDDRALVHALLVKGSTMGVTEFTADIEAPSPTRDTPAYVNWEALGFTIPYSRSHYVPA